MAKGTTTTSGARKPPPGTVPQDARGGTELPSEPQKNGAGAKAPTTAPAPVPGTQTPSGAARPNGAGISMMNEEVQAAVMASFERRKQLEDKRSEINADIKATRESLVARGLNKQVIDAEYKYWLMDDQKREGMDESRFVIRAAIGLPIQQADLFDPPSPNKGGPVH